MRKLLSNGLSGLYRGAGTLVTLLILIAIGYLGHHTEWSFSLSHGSEHHQDEGHDHTAKKVESEVVVDDFLRIQFRAAESITKSGISTIKVERRTMSEDVQANGVVGYDQRLLARLSSRVAGTVWRVEKFWGDAVRAGEVLAVIEAAEIGRMKAEFLTALAATKTNVDYLNSLEKIGGTSIPDRQLRQARLSVLESRIRLLNAEQALVNVGLNVRMEDYQELPESRLADTIHFIGLPKEMTDPLDRDKTTSNLVPLVAPFDGVVIGRDVGLGEVVDPTKPLFQIADVRKMWINLQVQREDAPKVATGQEVFFHGDGIVEELQGKLTWISTEVNEATRTLQVRSEVENKIARPGDPSATGQRLLRANIFGTGRIRIRTSQDTLVVPSECVQSDDVGPLVFVQTDEKTFVGRRVELGITTETHTEIHGDIQEGDDVAYRGSHILKSQVLLVKQDSVAP